jgi:hypothetical protein
VISEIIDAQVDFRRKAVQHFTTIAWQAAGGRGQAPDSLASAFTVQLSPFTTQTLMVERDQTPAQVSALSADVLKTLLQRAVDVQNRTQPDIAGAAGAGETENLAAAAGDQDPLSRRSQASEDIWCVPTQRNRGPRSTARKRRPRAIPIASSANPLALT